MAEVMVGGFASRLDQSRHHVEELGTMGGGDRGGDRQQDGRVIGSSHGFDARGGATVIGKITTAGVITEYSGITGFGVFGITAGPDGNVWFTERDSDRIARIRLRRQK